MTTVVGRVRKDVRLIGVISVVHLLSHFYQLTLAPVFPLIKIEMGLTNVELGFLVTAFFIASAMALDEPASIITASLPITSFKPPDWVEINGNPQAIASPAPKPKPS